MSEAIQSEIPPDVELKGALTLEEFRMHWCDKEMMEVEERER